MSDNATVRSMVEVAGWILDAAKADGLPGSGYVTINRRQIGVQLGSREDVHAWANWRGFTVEHEKPLVDPERFIVRASGQMYDVTLDVYTVTTVALIHAVNPPEPTCACAHTARQHTAIGCGANVGMGAICRCGKSSGQVEAAAIEAEHTAAGS